MSILLCGIQCQGEYMHLDKIGPVRHHVKSSGLDRNLTEQPMNKDNWKWWYFVVAGILIGAYGIYEFYTGLISKGIGSETLAVLCIVIGLFSRAAETKGKSGPEA